MLSQDTSISLFSPSSHVALTNHDSVPYAVGSSVNVVAPKDWDAMLGNPKFSPTHGSEATMAVVHFAPPCDDGGSAIDKFDVMRSHVDAGGHAAGDWMVMGHGVETLHGHNLGGDVVLALHHLLPGAGYKFKVAARNGLGRGAWSGGSGTVKTVLVGGAVKLREAVEDKWAGGEGGHGHTPDAGHILHGRGSGTHPHAGEGSDQHLSAIVDDVAQVVVLPYDSSTGRGEVTVQAWSGHWSPRGFQVSGEVAEVEFEEGGLKVLNGGEVEHRIAVVKRGGGVPIVRLALAAQAAGALAVVVVDDGRCDGIFDQFCALGADKSKGELWGEVDLARPWLDLRTPTVLVLQSEWAQGVEGKAAAVEVKEGEAVKAAEVGGGGEL